MHRISFILSILFTVIISVNAQTISPVGEWKFKDVYSPAQDSIKIEIGKKIFGDFFIDLKPNKRYAIFLMAQDEGVWSYNAATKKLITTADKGGASTIQLVSLTDSTMTINIDKTGGLVLRKTDTDSTGDLEPPSKNLDLVSATENQICHKWYFKLREIPGESEVQVKQISDLLKGSFLKFNSNYTYQTNYATITGDGKWQFGEGNQSIILNPSGSKNEKMIWSIKYVNNSTLYLIKGMSEEVWKFEVKN